MSRITQSVGKRERDRERPAADRMRVPPLSLLLAAAALVCTAVALRLPDAARFPWIIWVSAASPLIALCAASARQRGRSSSGPPDALDATSQALGEAIRNLWASPPVRISDVSQQVAHRAQDVRVAAGLVRNRAVEMLQEAGGSGQPNIKNANALEVLNKALPIVKKANGDRQRLNAQKNGVVNAVAYLRAAYGSPGAKQPVPGLDAATDEINRVKRGLDEAHQKLEIALSARSSVLGNPALSRFVRGGPAVTVASDLESRVRAVCDFVRDMAQAFGRAMKEAEQDRALLDEVVTMVIPGTPTTSPSSNITARVSSAKNAIASSRLLCAGQPLLKDALACTDAIIAAVNEIGDKALPYDLNDIGTDSLVAGTNCDEAFLIALGLQRTDLSNDDQVRRQLHSWILGRWPQLSRLLVMWSYIKTRDILDLVPTDELGMVSAAEVLHWAVFRLCRSAGIEPAEIVPLRTMLDWDQHDQRPRLMLEKDQTIRAAMRQRNEQAPLQAGLVLEVIEWGYRDNGGLTKSAVVIHDSRSEL